MSVLLYVQDIQRFVSYGATTRKIQQTLYISFIIKTEPYRHGIVNTLKMAVRDIVKVRIVHIFMSTNVDLLK